MNKFADKVILAGHRGERTVVPENTLAAFRYALSCGVDAIETDFHLTKDGHLVVIHDHTLERTTNGTGRVCEYTLAELRRLSAGGWFSERFAEERIPTAEEFFALTASTGILYNLELKVYFADEGEARAQLEAMGYSVRIRGLYWMQGENDRGSPNEYKRAFGYLAEDLRDDLGASLDIYVGEISKTFGGAETAVNNAFIAAQDAIVGATENCYIIASGNFKIGIEYGSPDTAHWSGADQYAIGKLLGESILANALS